MTKRLIHLFFLLGPLLFLTGAASAAVPSITVRGLTIDYSPFTLVAKPGEELAIGMDEGFEVLLNNSQVGKRITGAWAFTAPKQPGHYPVSVSNGKESELNLNLFVTVPVSNVSKETLNGYRIGPLPGGYWKHPELYRSPEGFIEVTEDLLDLQLSPHFTLRQFLCKQESDYPKYIVLKEPLLALLEALLGAVRERGYSATTFGIISGYRTPWYNRKIGNVPNSRHVYGDAMDFFVDVDDDGRMDDLNGDGRHNEGDVDLLATIAKEFMRAPGNEAFRGGVGRYNKNSRHGGFVHVDTRGYNARW
jgi:Peptidase M15